MGTAPKGFGVHICTGPVYVKGAEPGDVLEVRILDVKPRPCANPEHVGKSFGSNAAAWWGYQYKDLLTEPKPREVITIYELDASGDRNWAKAVYNFQWVPQTDPFGVVHKIIDYPGVPVDHSTVLIFSVARSISSLAGCGNLGPMVSAGSGVASGASRPSRLM